MKHLFTLLSFAFLAFNLYSQDWIPLNGPKGYSVYDFIVTNKTNELFVMSGSGEVFVSLDKGISWRNVTDGIIYVNEFWTSTIKFHETSAGKLFLLYAKHFYEFDYNNSNWIIRNDSVSLTDYTTGPNGTIYAGNQKSFYISEDDGTSFTRKFEWVAPKLHFECYGNGNNFVKLDTRAPIIRFDDTGIIIDTINMPDGFCGKILFDSTSGNLMNFNSLGLYKTKDRGKNWQRIDSIRVSLGSNGLLRMPNGKIFVFKDYTPIRFSEDGGDTWKRDTVYKSLVNTYNHSFHLILDDYTLFYYYEGFKILEPGRNPHGIILPLQNPLVVDLLTYGENRIICSSEDEDFFQLSKDNGLTWEIVDPPYHSSWIFKDQLLDANGNLYYLESDSVIVFNFETGELMVRSYPFDWNKYQGGFVSKTNKAFLFDGESLFVTADRADTWSRHPVKRNLYWLYEMKCSVNDILYYYNEDSIFYSFDFGSNWTYFLTNNRVLEIYQLSKNNIFYWLEDGIPDYKVFSSPDYGKTQLEEPGIAGRRAYHIDENDVKYYLSNNPDEIITTVHNGIKEYISDKGLDLVLNEPGYYHFSRNGYIYRFRSHKLPYRTTKKITTIESIEQATIELQAVPNPFSHETVLMLPKEFDSKLKHCTVYDVSGNIVFEFSSNNQNLKLSSDDLTNGFYIVHVTTDKNLRAVGKVMINR